MNQVTTRIRSILINARSTWRRRPGRKERQSGGHLSDLYDDWQRQLEAEEERCGLAAYNKAAALSPNPVVAYFNICATLYNIGQPAAKTVAACVKAIAADPKKADAYFVKGSSLYGEGAV